MSFRIAIILALIAVACSGETTEPAPTTVASTPAIGEQLDSDGGEIPPAPQAPTGSVSDDTIAAIEVVWGAFTGEVDPATVEVLGASNDARLGWLLSDILRFFQGGTVGDAAAVAFTELTGVAIPGGGDVSQWRRVTDLMIAWDLEAPPGYVDYKERLFTLVDVGWQPFFDDIGADVDWRLVSWGGVLIDNRRLGDSDPCLRGCIPALDDPAVTSADGGGWYPDAAVVFGVTVGGETRAYPKNIMEVHEMVNDTLGGRRIGMPYCTLCGSAQAFFTDVVPEGFSTLVLRTSGLLARSNKVMYDLENESMFDTFLGVALTGPLREAGLVLEPVTVVTTTWGEWKAAHPETTIVAQDGGIGRSYPVDPLRGRDNNGPVFPVGDVDPRLPVQEPVVGVVGGDGAVVAFPAAAARLAIDEGVAVITYGIELRLDGGGLRAFDAAGAELPTHESFWFAWSQFQPTTIVWQP